MTKGHKVKRGEIFFFDFGETRGSVQNGFRPVVVLQADEINDRSTTTIVGRKYIIPKQSVTDFINSGLY